MNVEEFMNEVMKKFCSNLEKPEHKVDECEAVEPPKTKARDLLNYLVEKSFDCGDVLIIPKRVIQGASENIID